MLAARVRRLNHVALQAETVLKNPDASFLGSTVAISLPRDELGRSAKRRRFRASVGISCLRQPSGHLAPRDGHHASHDSKHCQTSAPDLPRRHFCPKLTLPCQKSQLPGPRNAPRKSLQAFRFHPQETGASTTSGPLRPRSKRSPSFLSLKNCTTTPSRISKQRRALYVRPISSSREMKTTSHFEAFRRHLR